MNNGLGEHSLPQQRASQTGMDARVARVQAHCLPVVKDGFVRLARKEERVGQVAMRRHVIPVKPESFPIMTDRLGQLSGKVVTETAVVMGQRGSRVEAQGRLKMGRGLGNLSFFQKRLSEVVVRHEALAGNFERVTP